MAEPVSDPYLPVQDKAYTDLNPAPRTGVDNGRRGAVGRGPTSGIRGRKPPADTVWGARRDLRGRRRRPGSGRPFCPEAAPHPARSRRCGRGHPLRRAARGVCRPARAARKLFPANINAVVAVSITGIGFDRTEVRVIADPSIRQNTHEVEVEADFGRLQVRIENIPTMAVPTRAATMSTRSRLAVPRSARWCPTWRPLHRRRQEGQDDDLLPGTQDHGQEL